MKFSFLLLLTISSFAVAQQISEDAYTRYELLDPASHDFRILYEVSAGTPGAAYYFNTLRKGSDHEVDRVIDMATGKELTWTIVDGPTAKKNGYTEASHDTDYLQIKLAHPVAKHAEYRLLIDKTYKDEASYFASGDRIIFTRSLGIKRNSVVLPFGYELVRCNYPSQVAMEADGRIRVSFVNRGPEAVNLRIQGRRLNAKPVVPTPGNSPDYVRGTGRDKSNARVDYQVVERAHQTREIVYFLQQPESHSFSLYHDYTETRVGMDKYLNVVRAGSKASNPSAMNLDTGESLKVETLKGDQIKAKGIDMGPEPTPDTEVIVIWYDPVQPGQSTRIRITETYTDENRYLLHQGELIWDRAFGRVHNTVVLPAGWWLTSNSIPAVVDTTQDGNISLYYLNDSPDDIDVFIKAQRR